MERKLSLLLNRPLTDDDKKQLLISRKIAKSDEEATILAYKILDETKPTTQAYYNAEDLHTMLIYELQKSEEIGNANYVFSTTEQKIKNNISGIFNMTSIESVRRELNPQSNLRRSYILLDRMYATNGGEASSIFHWSFPNNSTVSNNSVNVSLPIQNIVGMKIYEFGLRINNIASDILVHNDRIFTFAIDELNTQSFIGPENRRFHFVGISGGYNAASEYTYARTNGDATMILFEKKHKVSTASLYNRVCNSNNNDGIFTFREPIEFYNNNISLSIAKPFQPYVLDQMTFTATVVVSGTYISSFTLPSGSNIPQEQTTTADISSPYTCQRVYISGFNTDDASDMNAVNIINRKEGFYYSVSSETITIDYSRTDKILEPGLTLPTWASIAGTPGSTVKVSFELRRFVIPIELIYRI